MLYFAESQSKLTTGELPLTPPPSWKRESSEKGGGSKRSALRFCDQKYSEKGGGSNCNSPVVFFSKFSRHKFQKKLLQLREKFQSLQYKCTILCEQQLVLVQNYDNFTKSQNPQTKFYHHSIYCWKMWNQKISEYSVSKIRSQLNALFEPVILFFRLRYSHQELLAQMLSLF